MQCGGGGVDNPFSLDSTLLFFVHTSTNSPTMVQLEKISSNRVSNGHLTKYKFPSTSLQLDTQFNIFLPSSASSSSPVPVLFYLAGLTCNEDTGAQKGGILNKAGEEGLAVVFPDTSPRGAGVEGEDDDWQLGTGTLCVSIFRPQLTQGAGFYLNATAEKWKKHYNMYDLIVKELPEVLKEADLGLVCRFIDPPQYTDTSGSFQNLLDGTLYGW